MIKKEEMFYSHIKTIADFLVGKKKMVSQSFSVFSFLPFTCYSQFTHFK